jgi:predicted O-linked N-acetylglucosamine transferase (SPINDLY family)
MPPPSVEQAALLIQQGRLADAADLLLRLLRVRPRDAAVVAMLCDVMGYQGDLTRAEFYIRRAIELDPRNPTYHHTLGEVLLTAKRFDEAAKPLETAAQLLGGGPDALFTHADALYHHERFAQAAAVAESGLRAHPDHAGLLSMRATALMQAGRADLALPVLRDATARHPSSLDLADRLAVILNYVPGVDPRETAAAHRRYGELLARSSPAPITHVRPGGPAPESMDQTPRLRIGLVSADLRLHACSFYVDGLLRGLDHHSFEVYAYHVGEREDERSTYLRSLTHHWRHCPHDNAQQLAARIAADRIDILLDLSGHTDGNRLTAFALKPAPIQITYLGYPNTTGVATIDYRLVDPITDPPGSEQYASEQLLRIEPCFLCYQGLTHVAAQPVPPSQRADSPTRGSITFGSFNSLLKINDPLIALWARVVLAVPGSRLVLKYRSLAEAHARQAIADRFAAAGLAPERLVLLPATGKYEAHLESYHAIDIGLDSYPYHGTTTTCEAMWMGVPVVTLGSSPDVHASRVGISLLSAVGLSEFVASTETDFIRIAAELAADPARLASIRSGLRERMLASPLCDAATFGRRVGDLLRAAWLRWRTGGG